jgi:hypothetical protein
MVSTDQYVSKVLGRLPHTRGKESEKERFVGGTIFIDEASSFVFAQHQVSLNAPETIRGNIYLNGKPALAGSLFVTVVVVTTVFTGQRISQKTLQIEHKPFDSQVLALIIRTELPNERSKQSLRVQEQ